MLGEELELNASLSRVHFKVNEKDKRKAYSSGTALQAAEDVWLWPKMRYDLCIHLSFEEETGEIYQEIVCPPESSETATFDLPMRCRYIPWHIRSWVSCFPTCYKSFITIQLNFSLYDPIPKPPGKFSFLDTSKHFYKCKQAPGGWLQRQEELLYLEA